MSSSTRYSRPNQQPTGLTFLVSPVGGHSVAESAIICRDERGRTALRRWTVGKYRLCQRARIGVFPIHSCPPFGFDVSAEGYLTLNDNYENAVVVLDELDKGASKRELARSLGISRSTVQKIVQNRERYTTE